MSRGGKKKKNNNYNYKNKDTEVKKQPQKNISKKERARRKKLIIAAVAAVVIILGAWIIYSAMNPIKVKSSSITLEYGEAISLKPSYYLAEDIDEDTLKSTLVILDNAKMDKDGNQMPGEYKLTLRCDKWTKNVSILVKEKE